MSVHNKKRQPITTRECDILLRASGFGVDEVNLGFNCNISRSSSSSKCSDDTGHTGFGRYFKGECMTQLHSDLMIDFMDRLERIDLQPREVKINP